MNPQADIHVGHAPGEGGPSGGWFVGDLAAWLPREAAPPHPHRQHEALEIKWADYAGGERREPPWAAARPVRTLCLLVEGHLQFRFRPPGASRPFPEEVLLRKPGDYVLWGGAVEHTWEAPAPCRCITIRWKESTPCAN